MPSPIPPILLPMRLLTALTLLLVPIAIAESARAEDSLTVYTYDSFSGKGSLGEWVEKKSGIKTKFVSFPSAEKHSIKSRSRESKRPRILSSAWIIACSPGPSAIGAFQKLDLGNSRQRQNDLSFDRELYFLPFDYGYVAPVYDSRRITRIPASLSLRAFAKEGSFRKKLVIEDPRTSSLGLAFLIWTHALFDESECAGFWKDLWNQIVTVAPGWSGAYALFLKKEADFVISYTTSPAYHREKESDDHFRAIIFPEGNYLQVEGVGVIRYSKKTPLARKWVEALLSPEVQASVPTTQWMYPAERSVKLPVIFAALPVPKPISVASDRIEEIAGRLASCLDQSGGRAQVSRVR